MSGEAGLASGDTVGSFTGVAAAFRLESSQKMPGHTASSVGADANFFESLIALGFSFLVGFTCVSGDEHSKSMIGMTTSPDSSLFKDGFLFVMSLSRSD